MTTTDYHRLRVLNRRVCQLLRLHKAAELKALNLDKPRLCSSISLAILQAEHDRRLLLAPRRSA